MKAWFTKAKELAAPFAVFSGVFLAILYFAGDAYIRKVAVEVMVGGIGGIEVIQQHEIRIVVVEDGVDDNEGDIEDVDEDIKDLEDRFNELIQKIIDKI